MAASAVRRLDRAPIDRALADRVHRQERRPGSARLRTARRAPLADLADHPAAGDRVRWRRLELAALPAAPPARRLGSAAARLGRLTPAAVRPPRSPRAPRS